MARKQGQKALLMALIGAITVVVLFVLTTVLQQVSGQKLVIAKLGSLIGFGTIGGLLLCLVSVILGVIAVRIPDQQEKRRGVFAIGIGSAILLAFICYLYLAMQSPDFGPVH